MGLTSKRTPQIRLCRSAGVAPFEGAAEGRRGWSVFRTQRVAEALRQLGEAHVLWLPAAGFDGARRGLHVQRVHDAEPKLGVDEQAPVLVEPGAAVGRGSVGVAVQRAV